MLPEKFLLLPESHQRAPIMYTWRQVRSRSTFLRVHHNNSSSPLPPSSDIIAIMEYLVNKNVEVARNILDLGMKKFVTEPAFIAEYAKFLMHLNEENSTS